MLIMEELVKMMMMKVMAHFNGDSRLQLYQQRGFLLNKNMLSSRICRDILEGVREPIQVMKRVISSCREIFIEEVERDMDLVIRLISVSHNNKFCKVVVDFLHNSNICIRFRIIIRVMKLSLQERLLVRSLGQQHCSLSQEEVSKRENNNIKQLNGVYQEWEQVLLRLLLVFQVDQTELLRHNFNQKMN